MYLNLVYNLPRPRVIHGRGPLEYSYMAKDLNEGDAAPAIRADDDGGQPFDLASLKGKNVVLYFFPKADTPG